MFKNHNDFKKFGKFIISIVKDYYTSSFEIYPYKASSQHDEPNWYIYTSLGISGNLRCEFRKWDYKPFFFNLFKGGKILLELDLTRVIESENKYTWYLSKPTNKFTQNLLSSNLQWIDNLPPDYIDNVRQQKHNFSSGSVVPKGGYLLADYLDKEKLGEVLQNFINQVVMGNIDNSLTTKKINFDFDDAEAEEGYQEDKRYLLTKRNASIVKKRKELDKYSCQACGFHLSLNGKQVIECHHLKPLADGETRITKIEDLICLCPTCHRIAHLRKPPFTIEEIKMLVETYHYTE